MKRDLVLLHGRAQQGRDPEALKQEWLAALATGLSRAGIDRRLDPERTRLPFYGDTLASLVASADSAFPPVIAKSPALDDPNRQRFLTQVVLDVADAKGIESGGVRTGSESVAKDPQNWPWILAILRAVEPMPAVGTLSLMTATNDVYEYLRSPGLQLVIDGAVRETIAARGDCVVVGHSLGSVIAYNVLRGEAGGAQSRAKQLVTLGSPLGVGPIAKRLAPHNRPAGVQHWYNAADPRDVVALRPLRRPYFKVPNIDDFRGVNNSTPNRHGIVGYLSDPTVAARIAKELEL